MNRHEIEEAVNQGRTSLEVELSLDSARVMVRVEDGTPIAYAIYTWKPGREPKTVEDLRNGLRRCYRAVFQEIESKYSQKLCRASFLHLKGWLEGGPIQLWDVLPLWVGEAGGTLTEEAARILDPTGNLRPGIPVTMEEKKSGEAVEATRDAMRHLSRRREMRGELDRETVGTPADTESTETTADAEKPLDAEKSAETEKIEETENTEEQEKIEEQENTEETENLKTEEDEEGTLNATADLAGFPPILARYVAALTAEISPRRQDTDRETDSTSPSD